MEHETVIFSALGPEFSSLVRRLRLMCVRVDDWVLVQRNSFDVTVDREPYHAIQFYFDLVGRIYLYRVWGRTVCRGVAADNQDLLDACTKIFSGQTRPCQGKVR
jgi:hypothetical protein